MKGTRTVAQDDFMIHRGARNRVRSLLMAGTALLAILASSAASALGLGQATVNSYLNQPLNARIDLISRSEAEMATVTAGLASPTDFQVMGLTRSAISIPLDFTINRDLADPHVRVTSTQAIEEPVVQLVVEVVWASGRMLRQYTLFLDPATFVAPAPLPATSTPRVADVPQKPVPAAEAPPVVAPEPEIATIEAVESSTTTFDDSSLSSDASLPTLPTPEPAPEVVFEEDVPAATTPPANIEDFGEVPDEPARLAEVPREEDSGIEIPAVTAESDADDFAQEADTGVEVVEPVLAAEPETVIAGNVPALEAEDPADIQQDLSVAQEETIEATDEVAESATKLANTDAEDVQSTPDALGSLEEPVEALRDEDVSADLAAANTEDLAETSDAGSQPTDVAEATAAPDALLTETEETPPVIDSPIESEPDQLVDAGEVALNETEVSDEDAGLASGPLENDEVLAVTEPELPPEFAEPDSQPAPAEDLVVTDELVQESEPVTEAVETAPVAPEPAIEEPVSTELVYRAVVPTSAAPASGGTVDVERGDTLWGISKAYADAQGLGVNQVMLAVQQKNPEAFLDDNINRLMAGEVLRMPEANEIQQFSAREAMLEVMRQEALYRTRWDVPQSPGDIPTISNFAQQPPEEDAGAAPDDSAETLPDEAIEIASNDAVDDSLLILVPPSEGENEEGMGQGSDGASDASEGISVVEELARTQEELANAQQENAYLADRISELESALERDAADDGEGVADTNLAEMEDRLRDERQAGDPEPANLARDEQEDKEGDGMLWLLLLGVIGAIFGVVVFLRSRRSAEFLPAGENFQPSPVGQKDEDPSPPEEALVEKVVPLRERRTLPPEPEPEAVEMDLEDPETKLDLARAYMAMGKASEAQALLEGVIQDGNEEQEREAREMLSEL